MVDQVSFGSASNLAVSPELRKLANYAVGVPLINQSSSPLDGAGLMLGLNLVPSALSWGKKAYRGDGFVSTFKQDYHDMKTKTIEQSAKFKDGGWKNKQLYADAWQAQKAEEIIKDVPKTLFLGTPKVEKYEKIIKKATKAIENAKGNETVIAKARKAIQEAQQSITNINEAFKGVKEAAEAAKVTGDFSKANKMLAEAHCLVRGQTAPTGFFSKVGRAITKYTGISKLGSVLEGVAAESPTMAKGLHMFRGNAAFAVIDGGMQAVKVVRTFAKLGFGSGVKQMFKSAASTTASVGGWAIGESIGAALGTLIPVPVVGTLVGGVVGGLLGSFVASKITGAFIKDELEIDKDKQAEALAKQAESNPQQLLTLAKNKLQEEGTDSPDAKVASDSLQKVASSTGSQSTASAAYDPAQLSQAPQGMDDNMALNPYFLAYQNALQKGGNPFGNGYTA